MEVGEARRGEWEHKTGGEVWRRRNLQAPLRTPDFLGWRTMIGSGGRVGYLTPMGLPSPSAGTSKTTPPSVNRVRFPPATSTVPAGDRLLATPPASLGSTQSSTDAMATPHLRETFADPLPPVDQKLDLTLSPDLSDCTVPGAKEC